MEYVEKCLNKAKQLGMDLENDGECLDLEKA